MNQPEQNRRKEILQNLTHYITSFVIIMKGVSKLENFQVYYGYVILFLLTGTGVILATIFHKKLEKRMKKISAVIYFLEGLVLLLIAKLYFDEGKSILPYVFLAAGLLSLAAGVIRITRQRSAPISIEEQKNANEVQS